jgi:hypothetical protein
MGQGESTCAGAPTPAPATRPPRRAPRRRARRASGPSRPGRRRRNTHWKTWKMWKPCIFVWLFLSQQSLCGKYNKSKTLCTRWAPWGYSTQYTALVRQSLGGMQQGGSSHAIRAPLARYTRCWRVNARCGFMPGVHWYTPLTRRGPPSNPNSATSSGSATLCTCAVGVGGCRLVSVGVHVFAWWRGELYHHHFLFNFARESGPRG